MEQQEKRDKVSLKILNEFLSAYCYEDAYNLTYNMFSPNGMPCSYVSYTTPYLIKCCKKSWKGRLPDIDVEMRLSPILFSKINAKIGKTYAPLTLYYSREAGI